MKDIRSTRNRANVLLFPGSRPDRSAPTRGPAKVLSLVERLTKRGRPAAAAAPAATREEA